MLSFEIYSFTREENKIINNISENALTRAREKNIGQLAADIFSSLDSNALSLAVLERALTKVAYKISPQQLSEINHLFKEVYENIPNRPPMDLRENMACVKLTRLEGKEKEAICYLNSLRTELAPDDYRRIFKELGGQGCCKTDSEKKQDERCKASTEKGEWNVQRRKGAMHGSAEIRKQMILKISETVSSRILPRINKRWETKDPNVMREITDKKRSGKLIKHYEHFSDEEILFQRACHYLKGTEKVVFNQHFKKIYSFPKNGGRGAFAQFFYRGVPYKGIIHFGIGPRGELYHRHFQTERNFTNQEQARFRKYLGNQHSLRLKSDRKVSVATSDFILSMDENRVLQFNYRNEEYFVKILPIELD